MVERAIEPGRRQWRLTPGFVVSGCAHAAALAFLLVHLSTVPVTEEQPETITVETISTSELNEITKGEKTAKEMPVPQRRVDKVAALEDLKPALPTPDARKDTPPEPSPDKAVEDPGQADKPVEAVLPPPRPAPPAPAPAAPPVAAAPPPMPPAPMPPVRPVEAQVAPMPPARPVEEAKSEPAKPDEDKPDAEALAPKPPPRPKQAKSEPKPKPEPKPIPRPVEKQVAKVEPKPDPAPKPAPKVPPKPSTLDQVASILDRMKPDKPLDRVASLLDRLKPEPPKPEPAKPEPAKPEPPRPVERPRAGNETKDAKPHEDFSPDKISAMLDHDAPQHRQSTGRSLAQVASLGLPNAHAEKLSPSMAAQLDGWLIDHYRGCWSYFGLGGTQDYVPQLRIRMAQDGSLLAPPFLLNPPSDPNLKSLADSAVRAVNRCNPLEIPERFRPYYDQGYKLRVIRFDPKEMS